jgi:prolyl 4-hydroxylase
MQRTSFGMDASGVKKAIVMIVGLLLVIFVAFKIGEISSSAYIPLERHANTGDNDVAEANRPWIEVKSWQPRIFVHHHLLTLEECQRIIEIATPKVERSTVVGNDGKPVVDNVRSSSGTFLVGDAAYDPLVRDVERRISEWTKLPQENGEHFYVLRYNIGQQYYPHTDFFDENDEGQRKFQIGGSGNRIATVLTCLQSPDEGGETFFPQINLNISCVAGNSILFWDSTPDVKSDPLSLHGGNAVVRGTKWAMTKWLRPMRVRPDI